MIPITALDRLNRPGDRLTIGMDLPLDNDWNGNREAGRSARAPGVPDLSDHARLATLADDLGFAALWVRDVPIYDPVRFGDAGSVFETFTHLGHLAATTRRVVIGTAAVVLPLRGALLAAKAAATVDVLSGGRFVLGVASGDRPVEYPLFGVDFERRGEIFRDSVDTLRAAWSTPRPGQGVSVPALGLPAELELDVLPKPPAGRVPIVVAGRAQQSLAWIAEHCEGWFNYPKDLTHLGRQLAEWQDANRAIAGSNPKPYLMPMMLDLDRNPDTAASPIFHGLRTGRHGLLAHLERLDRLKVSHLSLSLRCGRRPVEEVLTELAETVLPAFPSRDPEPSLAV